MNDSCSLKNNWWISQPSIPGVHFFRGWSLFSCPHLDSTLQGICLTFKAPALSPHPQVVTTNKSNEFTVIYYNARSLILNLDSLKSNCFLYEPDICCVVEIWLDDSKRGNVHWRLPPYSPRGMVGCLYLSAVLLLFFLKVRIYMNFYQFVLILYYPNLDFTFVQAPFISHFICYII